MLYAVTLISDPVTLTFDPEHLQCIACDVMKLYQIWTQASNPQWSYCYFNIWPNDLERRVMCCTYPCLNYSVFWCWYVMSRCDLDLWPLDLELLQHFGCHAFKLCTKFEQNQIIHGWVIDHLPQLHHAILGSGAQPTELTQRCVCVRT